jgi:transposase-like protein
MVSFDDFRKVLKKSDFEKIRSQKHETWRKILPQGDILRVRISHRHKKDIPKWLFHEMLRQAGMSKKKFFKLLKNK